ncbi:hypothetical protein, partial [Paramuribaculum intestinale]|uniref:hypothetical protein n=2 Tax=Paramuribaculum intestinale TaxID=2094151 RepID=UPI0025B64368
IRRWGGRGGWRSGRSRGACGQIETGVRRGAWATRRDSGAVAMRVVDPGWSRWYDSAASPGGHVAAQCVSTG